MAKSKITKAMREEAILDRLCSDEPISLLRSASKLPITVASFKGDGGKPAIVKMDRPECTMLSMDDMREIICDWSVSLGKKMTDWWLTGKEGEAIATRFVTRMQSDNSLYPKSIAFKDDPSFTFKRHAWNPAPGPCPYFMGILARITNPDAFAARIGSLFVDKRDRKQASWIYGERDCGKSTIGDLLRVLAGGQFAELDQELLDSPWWKKHLVAKPIAIVDESGTAFINEARFKLITGNDWHVVNDKNVKTMTAKIDSIFFFMSNSEPNVIHDEAIFARIIPHKLTKPSGTLLSRAEMISIFEAEAPAIAHYCVAKYLDIADKAGRIPCDNQAVIDASDEYEQLIISYVEKHFKRSVGAEMTNYALYEHMMHHGIRKGTQQRRCKQILAQRLGMEMTKKEIKTLENDDFGVATIENKRIIKIIKNVEFLSYKDRVYLSGPEKGNGIVRELFREDSRKFDPKN